LILGLVALLSTSVAEEPQVPPGGCLYRGKARTSAWVDVQFAKFGGKIAKIGGEWRDCGKGFIDQAEIEIASPAPGTEIRSAPAGSKVLAVVNAAEILAIRPFFPGQSSTRSGGTLLESRTLTWSPGQDISVPDRPEIVFHIRGIKSQGLTDGTRLTRFGFHHHDPSTAVADWSGSESSPEEWLVYCGTYTYVTTDGKANAQAMAALRDSLFGQRSANVSQLTVPSYSVYVSATREEFIEALASGLTLTDYIVETKTIRPRAKKGSDEKPYQVSQVVPKPVL
jgi:hypothetical protein